MSDSANVIAELDFETWLQHLDFVSTSDISSSMKYGGGPSHFRFSGRHIGFVVDLLPLNASICSPAIFT